MTCIVGCVTDDNRVVVVTDSAVGSDDGTRRLMSKAKIWGKEDGLGPIVVGEAGDDFALSRIRRKAQKHKKKDELKDPYAFVEMIWEIQKDIAGAQTGVESLEAELLHVGTDREGQCRMHIVGGEGGVVGPFPYTAVGDGASQALPLLDALIGKRCKKRTAIRVTNILIEILGYVDTYRESVKGPFHVYIFDPEEE